VATGAAGDLGELGRLEVASDAAVKLAEGGEGDMIDRQVEAHADGVGGDEVVDLAGLEEGDLGIAGARGEGAKDDSSAAAEGAEALGGAVDLLGGEGDDGAARR
jgi:hypothetical protein